MTSCVTLSSINSSKPTHVQPEINYSYYYWW